MIADEMVLIGRGKIVAQGTKAELLQTARHLREAGGPRGAPARHWTAAGIEATPSGDGGFRSEAEPVEVGRAAAAAGVVLVELRRAEGAGLEEMFLQLTADDAREPVTAARSAGMSTAAPAPAPSAPGHARHLEDQLDPAHAAGQGRDAQDARHPGRVSG